MTTGLPDAPLSPSVVPKKFDTSKSRLPEKSMLELEFLKILFVRGGEGAANLTSLLAGLLELTLGFRVSLGLFIRGNAKLVIDRKGFVKPNDSNSPSLVNDLLLRLREMYSPYSLVLFDIKTSSSNLFDIILDK